MLNYFSPSIYIIQTRPYLTKASNTKRSKRFYPPLFILVKTGLCLTNSSKTQSSLNAGSE